MVLYVGMKMLCLVKQSTTTKIEVNLSEVRRCSIKSMEIESHGYDGTVREHYVGTHIRLLTPSPLLTSIVLRMVISS